MATEVEETQAKEFLKRAEIRTMKKDLLKLREDDSLKERDKISKIRTLEEQLEEKQKAGMIVPTKNVPEEKAKRDEVLQKNEVEERIAEKDLKSYATEQERQQIFLLESQRLAFEKQVDAIDKERDPKLKLEKNTLLLQKRDWQTKLNEILEQEKKLEDEQKFIAEKSQITTIPSQKKGLEQSRWDLDKKLQDIEKKRWAVEKQIEDVDNKTSEIDKAAENLVTEKNELNDKVLGIDKSLREIYSAVMTREEEKIRGQAQYQIEQKEALAKVRAEQKESIQREQWTGGPKADNKIFADNVPIPAKKAAAKSFEAEESQRKKFLQDVETLSESNYQPVQNQQSTVLPPLKKEI